MNGEEENAMGGLAMGGRANTRTAIVVATAFLLLLAAAPARPSTAGIIAPSDPNNPQVDSGWQAGTCNAEPPEPGAETRSVDTPHPLFARAAAHPPRGC